METSAPRRPKRRNPFALEDGRVVAIAHEGRGLELLDADLQVLARLELSVLPDAQPTLADLMRDRQPELVVLTDPSTRYDHGIMGR